MNRSHGCPPYDPAVRSPTLPPDRRSSPSPQVKSSRRRAVQAAAQPATGADLLAAVNWHHDVGMLVRALDAPGFLERLVQLLGGHVSVANWVCIRYDLQAQPVPLAGSDGPPEAAQRFQDYLRRAYLIDPFYMAVRDAPELARQGLVTLSEVAPDQFTSTAYYQEYFRLNVLADEVQFLVAEGPGRWLSLSLGNSKRFTPTELGTLRIVAPWVLALVARRGAGDGGVDRVELAGAKLREQAPELTTREREVMHLMLGGNSAKLIARRLGISDETVKVHRRHIYAKYKVSTQSQLFSIFLARES